jgi:hypothetical protein
VKFYRDFYGDYLHDPLRHGRFTASARAMLPEPILLQVLGRAFVELHERAAALAGKARWADKVPENVLYLAEWERLLDDGWLFLHVVRNPLDTLASIKEAGFPLVIPADLDARIALYLRYGEAGLRFDAEHPERSYRILYEDLVSNPTACLVELMGWLDERLEPAQLAFNSVPHQSGLEDPKVGQTSEIHSRSVGRWTSLLTRDEARTVVRACRDFWSRADPGGRFPLPAI